MNWTRTDYTAFQTSSPDNRRLLQQEELILEITECILQTMQFTDMSYAKLAKKLGVDEAFVTSIFDGSDDLNLRDLANIADALGCKVKVSLEKFG